MMETIPLSALELGIDYEGYIELAKNIKVMNLLSPERREYIQKEAYEKLPERIFQQTQKLVLDLTYDREVYKIAEIPYHRGPGGTNLFTTAVDDYLLRERTFEKGE